MKLGIVEGMATYGDLSPNMWNAMRSMAADGEYILHPRTARALIERGYAKRVKELPSGEMLCRLTKAGKARHKRRYSRSQP